ncbi:hypothetical protein PR048_008427 [Dryococelus australis]|uniref:Uncharacterized protein n=1 Tax=Dryococelus australis TaxID=614101 RepID=A0ABQ9HX31_9NEOP|nr:hypothetical protein PR048_008427 [Dryococelus australis]
MGAAGPLPPTKSMTAFPSLVRHLDHVMPASQSRTTMGGGKNEIPEKTRRKAASSGTIPTCENPGVIRPGIEPGSPRWEASKLTAQPPRSIHFKRRNACAP